MGFLNFFGGKKEEVMNHEAAPQENTEITSVPENLPATESAGSPPMVKEAFLPAEVDSELPAEITPGVSTNLDLAVPAETTPATDIESMPKIVAPNLPAAEDVVSQNDLIGVKKAPLPTVDDTQFATPVELNDTISIQNPIEGDAAANPIDSLVAPVAPTAVTEQPAAEMPPVAEMPTATEPPTTEAPQQ
jgi:hypothetical protein